MIQIGVEDESIIQRFLRFSVEMTAFPEFKLLGTGQLHAYFDAVVSVVGQDVLEELLASYESVTVTDQSERKDLLRRHILGDEKLGAIARNVIKLWYNGGVWSELPRSWTESYGALPNNVPFAVSGAAYTEGLVWKAIGANPPGAKAPGYGSWSLPPTIPPVP